MSRETFPIHAAVQGEVDGMTTVRLEFRAFAAKVVYRPGDGKDPMMLEVPSQIIGHIRAPEGSSIGYASILGTLDDPLVLRMPNGECLTAEQAHERVCRGPRDGTEEALMFYPGEAGGPDHD